MGWKTKNRGKLRQLVLESQKTKVVIDPNVIGVINPSHKVSLFHSEDCCKLIVRIRREYLERELTSTLGYGLGEPIDFVTSTSINDPCSGTLIRAMELACQEVDDPLFSRRAPNFSNHIEGLLATAMLTSLTHSYSDEMRCRSDSSCPGYLKRAERFIKTNMAQPISIDDLVSTSGASMRTLYKAFNAYRNMTPMGYVKRVRLEQARQELNSPCSSHKTVAEVAMAAGMVHLGNFAADYKRVYGELPSETLKRGRNMTYAQNSAEFKNAPSRFSLG